MGLKWVRNPKPGGLFNEGPPESGGLFKRMTAAIQKVVRGDDDTTGA